MELLLCASDSRYGYVTKLWDCRQKGKSQSATTGVWHFKKRSSVKKKKKKKHFTLTPLSVNAQHFLVRQATPAPHWARALIDHEGSPESWATDLLVLLRLLPPPPALQSLLLHAAVHQHVQRLPQHQVPVVETPHACTRQSTKSSSATAEKMKKRSPSHETIQQRHNGSFKHV